MNHPKPTALKLLEGNLGRRPLNENEPKPIKIIPKCPSHIDKIARKRWKELSKYLFDLGLLTEIDGDALSMYCQAYSDWVQIEDHLRPTKREDGVLEYKDIQLKQGVDALGNEILEAKSNPRIKHKYELWKIMKGFLAEFGMTPSSRSRIGVQPRGKKDEMEAMLD